MNRHVEVLANLELLVERAKELFLKELKAAVQVRDRFTIALAGGSTPKPLYKALAEQDLPVEKIHVFWGDERYVAPDHADSNQLMARQTWLSHVGIPEGNIHPVPTSGNDPAADAQQHAAHLQEFFQVAPGEFPQFDLILLGIGDDAHTASLFPHTEALQVRDRLVTVGNKSGQPRITFTVPLINQARCVAFLVAGESKRTALTQIFAESADDLTYPARLIQPEGELWWLLDAAAARGVVQ
ncbi:MAG: 6-phosphogluconolactonase [Microcoleaceae cyanobacterium]